jgi:hypothetical protein
MAETLIPYELYALIQSIINKNIARINIPPNLLQPDGWIGDYTNLLTGQTGAITTPTVLPKTGSYTFQLNTSVQTTSSYNAVSLEVRLYYAPITSPINFATDPYYGLTTQQVDDPVADGVINNISTVLIPNIETNYQYQLGYATVSNDTPGNNSNIKLIIEDVFFTQSSGFQNEQTIFPPQFPRSVAIPTPIITPDAQPDDVYYLNAQILVAGDGVSNVLVSATWDFPWIHDMWFFIPSADNTQPAPEFPYLVLDINGNVITSDSVLPITDTQTGAGYVYRFYPEISATTTGWSFQLITPTGVLPNIPLFGAYTLPSYNFALPTPADAPPTPSDHNTGLVATSNTQNFAILKFAWDSGWNARQNPLIMIGVQVAVSSIEVAFPYDVCDSAGNPLSQVRSVQSGQAYVHYYLQLPNPPTTTTWSMQINQKVGGPLLTDMNVFVYY